MSRTYRKRGDAKWILRDYVRIDPDSWTWTWINIDPKSPEGKKELAKWRSDAYREFKEPGPAEFRNWAAERPHRRNAKEQLRKFILGYDIEVQILRMPKLPYWT